MDVGGQKPKHYYRALRREMLPFIPDTAREILDIGCGDGVFGAELKRVRRDAGLEVHVTGVEIVKERAIEAESRLDKVFNLNLERDPLDIPKESIDCIVCNDVLEHLVSPWQALRQLHRYLRSDGTIVASIPNVRFWGVVKPLVWNGEWNYQDEGVLDATHLRFFTRKSVRDLFEDSGYEVLELAGINPQVRGLKFQILRALTFGRIDDMQFLQYAVVARKIRN